MASQIAKKLPHIVEKSWLKNGRVKFVITAIGICLSYLYVGLLQEKIMKGRYGDGVNGDGTIGETFKYANTLVEVYLIFGFIIIKSK